MFIKKYIWLISGIAFFLNACSDAKKSDTSEDKASLKEKEKKVEENMPSEWRSKYLQAKKNIDSDTDSTDSQGESSSCQLIQMKVLIQMIQMLN